jgi:phytoene synthase
VKVDDAYEWCESITRREAKNFAYGIRLLRTPERQAMSAIYALARRIDDIGDGTDTPEEKLAGLQLVRKEIDNLDPKTNDPVLAAVADAQRRYDLPIECFGEIIDGCVMDVIGTSYDTIDELVKYCRNVAGSVGRLSLAIFGTDQPSIAMPLADSLGVALQLTNILRDVVEDRSFGRVYLPTQDALRVSCAPDLSGPASEIARLVAYECGRAEQWFSEGLQLLPLLNSRSRACVGAMSGIYRRLLVRIERNPLAVTQGRVSVPTLGKISVAIGSLVAARS